MMENKIAQKASSDPVMSLRLWMCVDFRSNFCLRGTRAG